MTTGIVGAFGARLPIIAAPMAGGPTTAELVVAAADAGGLGFVAGGYRSATQLVDQVSTVRASTGTYGVNLFVPNPIPVERAEYDTYLEVLQIDAGRYEVELPSVPREDDDSWRDKIDVLLENPAPVVSFTFGIPDPAALDALRRAGSLLVQTVTTADEAVRAAEAGIDALAVQASAAGGHSGTFSPGRTRPDRPLAELLREIGHEVGLPIIAAGGLTGPADVAGAIASGAQAVMVGTALLLAPEAGTSGAHRGALLGGTSGSTIVTRAFSGRPARALPNRFTDAHHAHAPAGYPAVHHLTSPIRKAAAAAGEPDDVNLWAGTGYGQVREKPVRTIFLTLSGDL